MQPKTSAFCALMLAMAYLALLPVAHATRVENMFSAGVSVADRSPESRQQALASALGQVLVRITGSAAVAGSPELEDLVENAARYVQAYRYSGSRGDMTLEVTFDGLALQQAVAARGIGVWGAERPDVLIWLAIDYGGGQRLLLPADNDGAVAVRLREAATARGLPVSLPLMDAMDRQRIGFADVWGGFTEAVEAASARYAPDAILIGRARRRSGGGLTVEWKLLAGGELLATRGSIADGVHETADFFARQFVVGGQGGVNQRLRLRVSEIADLEQYASVLNHLESLSMVDDVVLSEVRDKELVFDLNIKGSAEQLRRAIALGRIIEPAATSAPAPALVTELHYRPVL